MLRRFAKAGIAAGLQLLRADSWIGSLSGSRFRPLVVGYHRVVADFAASSGSSLPGMIISRPMLEAHLDWIDRRFRILSLDELGARIESGEPMDEPLAAVTFDDGYGDVYENAFPLLRRKGIPATVFVVTDVVGTSRLNLHDSLYLLLARLYARKADPRGELARLLASAEVEGLSGKPLPRDPFSALGLLLNRLPRAQVLRVAHALEAEIGIKDSERSMLRALSWPMLREMQAAGVEIGSHGRTHALLPNESLETMREEVAGSRAELERRLAVPIRNFAYPGGRWNAPAVEAVAAAGYDYAFTICSHSDPAHPLLTISRRMLWEQSCLDHVGCFSEAVMSCHAQGVFDLLRSCQPRGHALAGRASARAMTGTAEARS